MIVKTVKRCPHCKKAIDIRTIDVDDASMKEVQALFKALMRWDD